VYGVVATISVLLALSVSSKGPRTAGSVLHASTVACRALLSAYGAGKFAPARHGPRAAGSGTCSRGGGFDGRMD